MVERALFKVYMQVRDSLSVSISFSVSHPAGKSMSIELGEEDSPGLVRCWVVGVGRQVLGVGPLVLMVREREQDRPRQRVAIVLRFREAKTQDAVHAVEVGRVAVRDAAELRESAPRRDRTNGGVALVIARIKGLCVRMRAC